MRDREARQITAELRRPIVDFFDGALRCFNISEPSRKQQRPEPPIFLTGKRAPTSSTDEKRMPREVSVPFWQNSAVGVKFSAMASLSHQKRVQFGGPRCRRSAIWLRPLPQGCRDLQSL